MITINGSGRGRGRPKLIWDAIVKKYMDLLKLIKHRAFDRVEWQKMIHVDNLT